MPDIDMVVKEATTLMVVCYGIKTPSSSMTECRQQQWAQQIGKSTMVPKLCSLPTTTETFEQNFRRAHHDVALWMIEYLMPPSTSSNLLGVAVHQNDQTWMITVAERSANWFALSLSLLSCMKLLC